LSTFSSGGKILDTLGRWWDPFLHPRDRKGRFIETFGSIKIGLSSGGPSDDISASILFVDGNTSEVLAVIKDLLSPDAKSKGFEVGDIVLVPKEYFDVINEKARLDTPMDRSEENVPDGLKEIIEDTSKYTFKDINGNQIDDPFGGMPKASLNDTKTDDKPYFFDSLLEIPYETLTFVPNDPSNPDGPGKNIASNAVSAMIRFTTRVVVVVDINGVKVPFYISTGEGDKKSVEINKWYPFFGIGEDSWVNKGTEAEINDYYGSPELRAMAEWLDANIGNVRDNTEIPRVKATGSHIDFINSDIPATENKQSYSIEKLYENIKATLDKIESNRPDSAKKLESSDEIPPVPPRPVAPAFKGDELVALVESAGGDPEKLIQSLRDEELTIFDYETVGDGTFGKESTPIQIGAKKIKNGEVIDSFVKFINPGKPLGSFYYETEKDEKGWDKKDDNGEVIYILDDNGDKILKGDLKTDDGSVVDDAFLETQESLEDVHRQFAEWLGDDYILVGHNIISFDEPILGYQLEQAGVDYNPPAIIDTLNLSRSVNGDNGNKLTQLTEKYGIEHSAAHNAASDALATEQVLFKILEDMKRLDIGTDQLDPKAFEEVYREKMAEFILAKKAEKEAKSKLSPPPAPEPAPPEEPKPTSLWDPPPALDPVESMKTGAEGYAESIGKTLDNTGLDTVSVTPDVVTAVAQAYDNLPNYNEAAVPYFEAFRDETAEQYKYLTEVLGVKVEVTSEDPYANIEELFADLRDNNRIKVLSAKSTGEVPMFSSEQIEMFRAVHDAFGHAAIGRGFDRHGEEAAFRAHAQMYSDDAALALESVTRGQNASLIFNGKFPTQKIAILPRELSEVNVPKDTAPEQKTTSLIAEAPPEPNSKAQAMSIVRQYSGDVYNEESSVNPTITSVVSEEDIPIARTFKVNDEVKAWFESAGISTSDFYEVDNDDEVEGHKQFQRLVEAAKKKLKFGSSVAVLEDPGFPDSENAYFGTRQFVSSDGGAGFALNGDEIISAFSNGEGVNAGAADAMLQLAVQLGGRRLDAFDTILPEIYARSGFVTTARIPFNDEFAPEDWDFEEYKEFNNGRPDVVFMAYNPNMRILDGYKQGDGKTFESYDEAAEYNKEKAADYSQSPQTDPPLLGGYEISPDAPEQTFVNYDSKFNSVALSADESTVTIDDTQRDKASLTDTQRTLLSAKELQDEGMGEPVDDGPPSDWDGEDYYESTYSRQNNLLYKLPYYGIQFVSSWPESFEFVADMRNEAELLLSTTPNNAIAPPRLDITQKTALAGLDLVENSPETTEVLWRGMSVSDETLLSFEDADTMSISLAAFSSARGEVTQYTTFHSADSKKVILKLEPGAKAIPMVGFSPFAIIGEHVTSGEFEITGIEYDSATDTSTITIRQISTFDPSVDNSAKFKTAPIGAANEEDIEQVQTRVIQSRLGSEKESAEDGEIKELVAASIAEKLFDVPVEELIGALTGDYDMGMDFLDSVSESTIPNRVRTLIDHLRSLEKSENKSSSERKFFRRKSLQRMNTTDIKTFHPVFRVFDAAQNDGKSETIVGVSQDEIEEIIKIAQETVKSFDNSSELNGVDYNHTLILQSALQTVFDEREERSELLTDEEIKNLDKKLFALRIAVEAIRSPGDDWSRQNQFIGTLDELADLISEKFFDVTTDEGKQYMREVAVAGLVQAWAFSSNDSKPLSLAIQKAAEEEFDIEGAFQWSTSREVQEATDDFYSKYSNAYKRFVRAQYDSTQETLSDTGIEYVEAYRGYTTEYDSELHNRNSEITAQLRPLSSFSTSYETAIEFTGGYGGSTSVLVEEATSSMVIRSFVPKEQIFSFSFTGVGCTSEKEMVVLGPEISGKIINLKVVNPVPVAPPGIDDDAL
jgi:DNA polymerase III epsilon subunit-like protein